MDLSLSDEQRALVGSFAELLAKHSSPERVRAAEATGFDLALWDALVGTGVVEMAVPEADGGWGAGLLDLTLVAEQLGSAAAPAPTIEAQVASRLLARLGSPALADVLAGGHLPTMAVRPVPADGGEAPLVPAGAVAGSAVVLRGDQLLRVALGEGNRRPVANLASAPLADVALGGPDHGHEVLATGADARAAFEAALDEWLALTASALVGLGAAAHGIACEYARERKAWNQPIGAYQAIAHPLADDATALDGARLLAGKAAWELQVGGPRGRELAAMAFAYAAEAARKTTYDAVHAHGGYGFMLEYDVQLHHQQARGWARVWGEPKDAHRRALRARHGLHGGR